MLLREMENVAKASFMIEFICPNCQRGLKVKPELAGRIGKCPGCGDKIRVPEDIVAVEVVTAEVVTEEWHDENVLATEVESPRESSYGLVDDFPARTTPPDWVFMPNWFDLYALPIGGVMCLLMAIMVSVMSDGNLFAFPVFLVVGGVAMLAFGIYFIANVKPVISITAAGLYCNNARKTIAWQDIEGAFYWNPADDASVVSKFIAGQLTGNSDGEVMIRIRFTPQGRQKHKKPTGFVMIAPTFVDGDMLISRRALRFSDLKVIDIAAEINKRVHAARHARGVGMG